MSAATYEQATRQPLLDPASPEALEALFMLPSYEAEQPLVFAVPEMASDFSTRQNAAKFIGAVLAGHLIESPVVEHSTESLHEGIQRAANGDLVAYKMVETNAATDVIERTIKVGHVGKKLPLGLTAEKKIVQYGQSYDSVQANSLHIMAGHPIMQPRTEAEARNAFRAEDLNRQGYFDKGYSMVVFSLAERLPQVGFYTETMSCAIQVTSKDGDSLAIEPAFVAGIAESGGEQHDHETVAKVFAAFGIDVSGKTPAEIIDTPLLIHNSLIPNGAIDVVKLWDDCAGGTFFGENKPRQDYLKYREQCKKREEGFKPKVDQIVAELIAEAPQINSPEMAVQRLHKISEKHMVEHAIQDKSIDPRVFGSVSAGHIEKARWYQEQGNYDQARSEMALAAKTARSSSCPSALKKANELEDGTEDSADDVEDEYGSLHFRCPKGHLNTRPFGHLISKCKECGTSVKC